LTVGAARIVEMQAARGGTHREAPSGDEVLLLQCSKDREAGAGGVHVDIDHVDAVTGGDTDVRPRMLLPPRTDLVKICGGVVEPVLGEGAFAARHAREHRYPGGRIRGCRVW